MRSTETADQQLPIDAYLGDITDALERHTSLIVEAAPGAGKSTRVPPAIERSAWIEGKRIVVLEPRRIAARNLAHFLARERGERLGDSIGLTVRDESRVGPNCRIEIVTEGILTRRIQSDPELTGTGAILFDEFHERHLSSDLALALTLEVQQMRDDLRVVIMSATLDTARVSTFLGGPVISCPGRSFPITTDYLGQGADLTQSVRAAVLKAIEHRADGVLVFLPGIREIERCQRALNNACAASVQILHGSLTLTQQASVLSTADTRRVILSTNIAESSLTVPGIDAVVDSGLARVPQFDPGSGLTGLVTRRIDRESADQRRGRAGRLRAGQCLRLWSHGDRLDPARRPEILSADLSGLALEVAAWGARTDQLQWLDSPPAGALGQAHELLATLGALDEHGRVTATGRRLASWGCTPRLAAILDAAILERSGSDLALACDLVALLEMYRGQPASDDIERRLRQTRSNLAARMWRRRARVGDHTKADPTQVGRIALAGYGDRVARRRDGSSHRYIARSGRGIRLTPGSDLAGADWIVALDVAIQQQRGQGDALVRCAAALDGDSVSGLIERQSEWHDVVRWCSDQKRVDAFRERRLGAIVLERKDLMKPNADLQQAAMLDGVRELGVASLHWTRETRSLRERVRFLRGLDEGWPDLSDEWLLEHVDQWLGDWLSGCTTARDLSRIDLMDPLRALVGWERMREVDVLAPVHWLVPSGRRVRIDYQASGPVLAIKLQEMFGSPSSPAVAQGAVPITLHLLSPAARPLQITQDLAHFWENGYPEVRKEMRGRYPKHPWPEDPVAAEPTAKTKRARS